MGVFMHVMLVSTSFMTTEPSWFYSLVFLMGIEQPARFVVGYVYLSEFCLEKFQRPIVTTIALFFVAESATLCALYFLYINKSWVGFEVIGLSFALLCLISMAVIPESPRWLISKGMYRDALKVYTKIAKINGKVFTEMIYKLSRENS